MEGVGGAWVFVERGVPIGVASVSGGDSIVRCFLVDEVDCWCEVSVDVILVLETVLATDLERFRDRSCDCVFSATH